VAHIYTPSYTGGGGRKMDHRGESEILSEKQRKTKEGYGSCDKTLAYKMQAICFNISATHAQKKS
jgi:hypothetical protein